MTKFLVIFIAVLVIATLVLGVVVFSKAYSEIEDLSQQGTSTDQGGSSTDQGGSSTDQGGSSTDQGGSSTDQGGSSTDQGNGSTDQGGQTPEEEEPSADALPPSFTYDGKRYYTDNRLTLFDGSYFAESAVGEKYSDSVVDVQADRGNIRISNAWQPASGFNVLSPIGEFSFERFSGVAFFYRVYDQAIGRWGDLELVDGSNISLWFFFKQNAVEVNGVIQDDSGYYAGTSHDLYFGVVSTELYGKTIQLYCFVA